MPIKPTYMLWDKPIDKTKDSTKVEGSQFAEKPDSQLVKPKNLCVFLVDLPVDKSKKAIEPFVPKFDSPKHVCQQDKTLVHSGSDKIMPLYTQQGEINMINDTPDDEYKVIRFNRRHPSGNYIVLNKKLASATVYEPDGSKLKTFEIGTGRDVGDALNDGYGKKGKETKTTPAGEYRLKSRGGCGYGPFIFKIGNDYTKAGVGVSMALHIIPDHLINERLPKFDNGTPDDNRMSAGCVNFKVEDFKKLADEVTVGAKVYILPEDSGNYLKLEKQKNGKLRFIQNKYHPRTY